MNVIELRNVWKTYDHSKRIGIKELLVGRRKQAEGRFSRNWALQDISFTVQEGRSLGIVGHNGTGKSTLLTLMLGIIQQDRGDVSRRGKLGAMLELGSGFHPELTGRENIFLNGSVLGLRIREIKAIFDSIVEFSELGPAIDNPMRTYSNGMWIRLAFAVLAHAHSDVLLIDELLTVGDTSYQRKCSEYLRQYQARGGTLVIVSHDLTQLYDLCSDGVCLHEGKLAEWGTMSAALRRYKELAKE